ncbi:MAG: FtsW/RodA/SpoVE family cell cycle protein, partial [Oscillospiraceae bacterium]
KMITTAGKCKDLTGTLICVGVFTIFFIQVIVNTGMSLSITPVIGITLPFFSSGGSSMVISYISIGLVLSVYRHNKKSMFESYL